MHAYCINNFQQCKMHSYEESPMCPNSFFIRVSLITYTHTQFFNKKGLYVQFCSLSFYLFIFFNIRLQLLFIYLFFQVLFLKYNCV